MAEYRIAALESIQKNSMQAFVVADQELVLFCDSEGAVSALEDCCSHALVKLSEGSFEGRAVTCPAHGAMFDVRTGEHLTPPAYEGVRSFPVSVRDGSIFVEIEES